jgi:hypothetical protein
MKLTWGLIAEVHPDTRVLALPYSTHEVVVFANAQHPFFERDSISIKELQKARVVQREFGLNDTNCDGEGFDG